MQILRQAADSVAAQQVFPTHSIPNFSGLVVFAAGWARTLVSLFGEN